MRKKKCGQPQLICQGSRAPPQKIKVWDKGFVVVVSSLAHTRQLVVVPNADIPI